MKTKATETQSRSFHLLNPRQQRFVLAYIEHGQLFRAYQEAGYIGKKAAASDLLRRRRIQATIAELQEEVRREAVRSNADLAAELDNVAFASFADLFIHDESLGRSRPRTLDELPPQVASALAEIATDEEGHLIPSQCRFHSKIRALEASARIRGLFDPRGTFKQNPEEIAAEMWQVGQAMCADDMLPGGEQLGEEHIPRKFRGGDDDDPDRNLH